MRKDKQCGCSLLDNYSVCNDQQTTNSDATETIQDTQQIFHTDQIIIIRKNGNRAEVYQAKFSDLAPEVALLIIKQATKAMPRTDPSDGCSLWIDEGFVRIASGDPSSLGSLSPTAMQKSLAEAFKILPTSDPGDGS
ncbi:unnamed protein product, partial [Commensalibacter communis]